MRRSRSLRFAMMASTSKKAGSTPAGSLSFASAEVGAASPFWLIVTFSANVSAWDAHGGMTVTVGGSEVTVDDGHVWGGKAYLTLHNPIAAGDTVTVAYNATQGNLAGASGGTVGTFTAQAVTNNVVAPAHTYYVAKTGNDSAAGTIGAPWLTIQKAADTVTAGDLVYIRAGTYAEKVTVGASGSAGRYIQFRNYPSETVTIDGQALTMENWEALVYIHSKSYVWIDGLRVINARNTADNGTAKAIRADGPSDHIIIRNCYTQRSASCGIWMSTSYGLVDACEIVDACKREAGTNGSEEPISVPDATYTEVKNNNVHDVTVATGGGGEGINVKVASHDVIIHDNIVHDCPNVYGFGVDGWNDHLYNVSFYRNKSYGNKYGFIVEAEEGGNVHDILLYNNLAYNLSSGGAGFMLPNWGGNYTTTKRNLTFINNTAYNCPTGYYGLNTYIENVIVRNNLFAGCGANMTITAGGVANHTIDHNLFYAPTTATGTDAVQGDPLFVNKAAGDFRIGQGSAAIGAGAASGAPGVDYLGTARGAAIDIGAYEWVSGAGQSWADANIIVNITHDTSTNVTDASNYSSKAGTPVINTTAALKSSTNGLQCDASGDNYGVKNITPSTSHLRARFYFDPNSITISSAWDGTFIFQIHCPTLGQNMLCMVNYYKNTNFYLQIRAYNDAGGVAVSWNGIACSDAPHYIEVYIKRAASSVSADGTAQAWVDGTAVAAAQTGIDNYDLFADAASVYLGTHNKVGTVSGNVFLDELVVNNDGAQIGA